MLNDHASVCRCQSSDAPRGLVTLAVVALLLLGAQRAWAAFPTATGYVTDAAQILDGPTRDALTTLVGDVEQQTTAEIAVVTVPSLDGMTVEEYANKLFQAWGIGKKGHDNGVLVLVAPNERKMRIEVGYGLEPILPDGLAGEIIRTSFTPAFAKRDYSGGITQGVQRIAAIVRANHTLSPEERRRLSAGGGDRPPALLMIPFFGIFVALGAFAVGVGLRSKTVFPILWGGLFGGIPMAMALLPFFNASQWVLVPLAIAMGAWGYAKGESATWKKTFRGGSGSASSGGWVMGGSDGSSGGGSSGGGSFGGGSSGGGGASGSW